MQFDIIAVGTKMPRWVQEAYTEYEKRLPKEWTPRLKELPLAHRGKSTNDERVRELEAQHIRNALPRQAHILALDVRGETWSTEQLATQMAQWRLSGKALALIIGGPDGLAPELLSAAHQRWSLSALTLPHPLVRVVLIEQVYRAWTILQNHPYHK